MPLHLTTNQTTLLTFLKNYISVKGFAPSISEIQKELKIKTKRGVVQYLIALETKGLITRSSKPRGIHIVEQYVNKPETIEYVPIVGYANAQESLSFAFQDKIGSIQVDKTLLPINERCFALILKGDSMNKKLINYIKMRNNNYVIISRTNEIYDNDAVLVSINDKATIRSYKRAGSTIILFPESDNIIHRPIYLSEESKNLIQGKVIAVLENI